MARSIGIGVIGLGWMGQAHSRSYRSIPAYFPEAGITPRLVAIADNLPERVELAKAKYGYEFGTTDWRELIERDDIDAVYLSLPPSMHAQWCVSAAEAGKHILCEKPLAVSAREANQIDFACHQAGVRWLDATGWLHHGRTAQMLRLAHEGRLGQLGHGRNTNLVPIEK